MSFLSPITALIAAGIAIPALISLYFLKLRRRRMDISSTLLWKKAIQDMQVNAPFQRLRRNLLLLLQLLLLAALLLAMARPATRTTASAGQRVVIVLDHSASMNATDPAGSAKTRLAAAKTAALDLIDNFNAGASGGKAQGGGGPDAGGGAMLVTFADQARVVQPFTGDLTRLRRAVHAVKPTDGRSRLGPALRLIEPFASQAAANPHGGLVVYVLSDGRVERNAAHPLALRGADLRYVQLGGRRTDNVGVVSFSARRDFKKPRHVQIFARLANYGPSPITTNVTLRVNGQVQKVKSVTLPPAKRTPSRNPAAGKPPTKASRRVQPGGKSLQFDFVLPGTAMVRVSQDHPDALAADDAARIMLAPARRLRVLLVGRRNAFLERVIRSVGVRDVVLMSPQKYENQNPRYLRRGGWSTSSNRATRGFDLIVFDDYAPKNVPPVSSLSFGAAPPIKGLKLVQNAPAASSSGHGSSSSGRSQGAQSQVILNWRRDHPLMRYVTLDDVVVSRPGRLVVPEDATVLATGQAGPIMAEVPARGREHVVVSFDVLNSNWPLYVSFPVFISNTVQTLGLGVLADKAGLSYTTGQVAVVPTSDRSELSYAGPVPLTAAVSQGRAVLPMFRRVGVYQARSSVEPPFNRLPVNLLDSRESDVQPVDTLQVGTSAIKGRTRSKSVRREVWRWFGWGALGLLMIEWLVYTRRMHL